MSQERSDTGGSSFFSFVPQPISSIETLQFPGRAAGLPPVGRQRSFGSHDFSVLSFWYRQSKTGTTLVLDESLRPIVSFHRTSALTCERSESGPARCSAVASTPASAPSSTSSDPQPAYVRLCQEGRNPDLLTYGVPELFGSGRSRLRSRPLRADDSSGKSVSMPGCSVTQGRTSSERPSTTSSCT